MIIGGEWFYCIYRKKRLNYCLPTPALSGSGHEGLDLSSSSPSTLAIITLLGYNVKWISFWNCSIFIVCSSGIFINERVKKS